MNGNDPDRYDLFLRYYTRHEPALRGYVRSLVPTRDDASEIMQEVAVVLWRKLSDLDDPKNFRKWAFGVARIQLLSWRRDKARDRHIFTEEVWEMLADESSSHHEKEHQAKMHQTLAHCLERLPKDKRHLLERAYGGDTRIDNIAEEEGRTPMSVYKVLHRLRMKLLECIQQNLNTENFA
ncbi:MAG: sigma-70 family RNA polymerase sigma factor [Verrucomicrobiota bacterium]